MNPRRRNTLTALLAFPAGLRVGLAQPVAGPASATAPNPAPASARPQPKPAPPRPDAAGNAARGPLLMLGDSLSAEYGLPRGSGWVALMARRLSERKPPLAVVNASISGETTAGGLSRIDGLLAQHKPSIVIIELGGNDALRGLDLGATESNLAQMARRSRAAGARVLLVGMMMPPNYGKTYADRFASLFRTVASQEKTELVPFLLESVADRIELFQADRIHPNEMAQATMLDNVWPTLSRLLPTA